MDTVSEGIPVYLFLKAAIINIFYINNGSNNLLYTGKVSFGDRLLQYIIYKML